MLLLLEMLRKNVKLYSFITQSIIKGPKYPPLKTHSISRELEVTANLHP